MGSYYRSPKISIPQTKVSRFTLRGALKNIWISRASVGRVILPNRNEIFSDSPQRKVRLPAASFETENSPLVKLSARKRGITELAGHVQEFRPDVARWKLLIVAAVASKAISRLSRGTCLFGR